jgi:CBS domain-containing protein
VVWPCSSSTSGPLDSSERAGPEIDVGDLERVLDLRSDVIAAHVVRRVPRAVPDETAGCVRSRLVGMSFDSAADVAVCDGDRLVGLVTVEGLLAADPDARIGDLMDDDPPVVGPGVDRERAAWKAAHHGEGSLAVVDGDGSFVGLVPPAGLLEILLSEHDEDIARLSGFLHDVSSARRASEEPLGIRLRHRLPWLLVGLAGAVLAAVVVQAFERDLQANVAVSFFVPGIVYLADAVGTQTEALIIRGLSIGIPVRRVIRSNSSPACWSARPWPPCSYPSGWRPGIRTWFSPWRSPCSPPAQPPHWRRCSCRGSCSGRISTPPSAADPWPPSYRICSPC